MQDLTKSRPALTRVPETVFIIVVGTRFCKEEDDLLGGTVVRAFMTREAAVSYRWWWEPIRKSAVEVVPAELRHLMLDVRVTHPDTKLVLSHCEEGGQPYDIEVLSDPSATIH